MLFVSGALFHTKSALDSIAVFLSEFLPLTAQGGDRDFKKPYFRQQLNDADSTLGTRLHDFEPWFDDLQEIRDEWIHRSSIRCMLINGSSEVGALRIPRTDLESGLRAFSKPINNGNFFSTKQFLDYHYGNIVGVFCKVVERSIERELVSFPEPQTDAEVEKNLSVFPMQTTWSGVLRGTKYKSGPLGF